MALGMVGLQLLSLALLTLVACCRARCGENAGAKPFRAVWVETLRGPYCGRRHHYNFDITKTFLWQVKTQS